VPRGADMARRTLPARQNRHVAVVVVVVVVVVFVIVVVVIVVLVLVLVMPVQETSCAREREACRCNHTTIDDDAALHHTLHTRFTEQQRGTHSCAHTDTLTRLHAPRAANGCVVGVYTRGPGGNALHMYISHQHTETHLMYIYTYTCM